MLKRLKTHHLFRRVSLLPFSTNHYTLWRNPLRRRRGSGAQAIGSGDNRRRQIAFLIRSFINPRTCMEGIICNITTSSRFYLVESPHTFHDVQIRKRGKGKKLQKQDSRSDYLIFSLFTASLVKSVSCYKHMD